MKVVDLIEQLEIWAEALDCVEVDEYEQTKIAEEIKELANDLRFKLLLKKCEEES